MRVYKNKFVPTVNAEDGDENSGYQGASMPAISPGHRKGNKLVLEQLAKLSVKEYNLLGIVLYLRELHFQHLKQVRSSLPAIVISPSPLIRDYQWRCSNSKCTQTGSNLIYLQSNSELIRILVRF